MSRCKLLLTLLAGMNVACRGSGSYDQLTIYELDAERGELVSLTSTLLNLGTESGMSFRRSSLFSRVMAIRR